MRSDITEYDPTPGRAILGFFLNLFLVLSFTPVLSIAPIPPFPHGSNETHLLPPQIATLLT